MGKHSKHTKHRSRSRSRERSRDESYKIKKRRSRSRSSERDRGSYDSHKARKRRSKSRSVERDHSSSSSKSKGKKSSRRSRSPSPSRDYLSKRRNQRSRSRSPLRESRLYGRQRSRSRSRGHQRSRSRSRGRQRSRSRSRGRQRSRSRSRGRQRSRSRSRGQRSSSHSSNRSRRRRSRSGSRSRQSRDQFGRDKKRSRDRSYSRSPDFPRVKLESVAPVEEKKTDPFADVPGFDDMTPAEKTKVRMQKALEAAASADAALRQKGLLQSGTEKLTFAEQMQRQQAIEDIEQDDFVPSTFKSSQDSKPVGQTSNTSLIGADESHDSAIFGGSGSTVLPFTVTKNPKQSGFVFKDRGPLASHSLFVSPEEKEERWIEKLKAMREEKMWKYRASLVKQEF